MKIGEQTCQCQLTVNVNILDFMTNFAFLPTEFRAIADAARKAEGYVVGDLQAACLPMSVSGDASQEVVT